MIDQLPDAWGNGPVDFRMPRFALRIALLTVLLLYGVVSLAEQYTIPLFLPATAPGVPQGVLRIVNADDESGAVAVHAIDDAGVRSGPATFTLGALAAVEFDAADLANGNGGKGLSGGIGAGSDVRRLEIDSELPIEVLAYARAADGTLAVMHGMVPAVSGDEAGRFRYEVHIFNPSVDATQSSRLRLINTGGEVASVTISARDDTGAPASGGEVRLVLPEGNARTLTAWQMEAGDGSIEGRLGAGVGRWRLSVTSDQPIGVVNVAVASAGQWRNLSTVELAEEEADDRAALVALYNATDGVNWTNNANWLSDSPIGEWHGVTTDENGRVLALELPSNQLSGSIPVEIGALTNLIVLNLQNNQLSGTIPAEIGNLSNLQVLILQGNQLSGSIPAEIGALANLQGLILQSNQLSGPIPIELGGLANLEVMDLANNRLSGSIPTELRELANLKVLILQGNQLSGSIPPELGGLANLQTLILGGNEFTGCIPSGLQNIADDDFSALGLPFCDAPAGPDLVIQSPLVSDGSPGAGESFTLSVTVRNQGDHESVVTTLRYYRSTDATISSSDTELGTESVNGLAMSSEHGGSISLTAPSNTGTYYYGACVDAVPDEVSTANNCSVAVPVTVRDGDQGVILPSTGDRAALVALYNATDGANWTNNANWLSDAPISEWHGVTVDSNGTVVSLRSNRLNGPIPAELGDFSNLVGLNLGGNRLSGPIPAELAQLASLEYLDLSYNLLSGPIPAELGILSNLVALHLHANHLTGPTPVELGELASLEYLSLGGNRLNGPVPAELGNLSNLVALYLHNNQLSGPVPAELGNLSNLVALYLYNNQLSGPVPTELGDLASLEYLSLGGNRLNGPVPVELGNLSNLAALYLHNNQLSGPVPAELGNLSNLVALYLYNNRLSGAVPVELGDLASLEYLSLGGNRLSDPVPVGLGGLVNLEVLDLRNNQLSGSIPVELGQLDLRLVLISGNQFTGCIPSKWRESPINDFHLLALPFCGDLELGAPLTRILATGFFAQEVPPNLPVRGRAARFVSGDR